MGNETNWTPQQRRAIEERTGNMLVSASAGSGKTAVLVERIKRQIIEDRIPVTGFLVVTFTRAAASEMKAKIRQALIEEIENSDGDTSFLREQLEKLPVADISTFDSFAYRIIKEYFHIIDIEPGLQICDEDKGSILKDQAMDAVFSELFNSEDNEDFIAFLKCYSKARSEDEVKEQLRGLYDSVRNMPDYMDGFHKAVQDLKADKDGSDILEYLKTRMPEKADSFLPESREVTEELGKRADTLELILTLFEKKYREIKEQDGLVDFGDVQHYAIEILRNEDVRREMREKYSHILVDEYQDGNYLQEEIINSISTGDNIFMVGDLKQSIYGFRMAEPEIFREKYARYADNPAEGTALDLTSNFRSKKTILNYVNLVFKDLMDGYERGALTAGVESDEEILIEPTLHIVKTKKEDDDEPVPGDIDPALEKMKGGEIEAEAVAGIIQDRLGTEIYDRKEGRVRPLEKKDIVVLMRGVKDKGERYYNALMSRGIDTFIDDNEGYFDKIEVETFTNLLRVVDNSRRDIPLLSVLDSSIFGFSVNQLIEIRIFAKEKEPDKDMAYHECFRLYGQEGPRQELREKVTETLERISRWQAESRIMPVSEFAWKLLNESGYFIYAGALPAGEQRQVNLRAYVDKAVAYERSGDSSLFGFLRYIETIVKKKTIKIPQIKMVAEGQNAVRIMTVHKSKGLEFPMVVLCDTNPGPRRDRSTSANWIFDRDLGLGMKYVNTEKKYEQDTLRKLAIIEKNKEKELEEEKRILYVALTRACDILETVASVKTEDNIEKDGAKPEKFFGMIYPAVKEQSNIRVHTRDQVLSRAKKQQTESQVTKLPDTEPGEGENPTETEAAVEEKLNFVYPYADELTQPSKVSVTELAGGKAVRSSLNEPSFKTGEGTVTGARRGTATHKLMEYLPFAKMEKDPTAVIWETLEQLQNENILTADEAESVDKKQVLRFFETEIGKRAMKAAGKQQLVREKQFTMLHKEGDREIMVQGVIDCFFTEGDSVVLIDFKTDKTKDGLKEKYIKQLQLYREALENRWENKEIKTYLYWLAFGEAEEVPENAQ